MDTPANFPSTVTIDREQLDCLMGLDDYYAAVEAAFLAHAEGRTRLPLPLYIEAPDGGFHGKGAFVALDRPWVAVKVNSNFPGNPAKGLPTIQGAVLLYDATDGRLLAILDSSEITSKRTAAASALAAHHLSREDSRVIAICGCGEQGRAQLAAIARVRKLERAYAWDADAQRARDYARDMAAALGVEVTAVTALREATLAADIIVTATSSRTPFLGRGDVKPGTFIAAIGADNPHKSELLPELFWDATVVPDSCDQAAIMGDLHHAMDALEDPTEVLCNPGIARASIIHCELADIVAGRKPGRTRADEITIFDSTGLAIQDVVAAAMAYTLRVARS